MSLDGVYGSKYENPKMDQNSKMDQNPIMDKNPMMVLKPENYGATPSSVQNCH